MPGTKQSANDAIAQQGIYGKWTTVGQKEMIRIASENVGTMIGRSRKVAEMLLKKRLTCIYNLPAPYVPV